MRWQNVARSIPLTGSQVNLFFKDLFASLRAPFAAGCDASYFPEICRVMFCHWRTHTPLHRRRHCTCRHTSIVWTRLTTLKTIFVRTCWVIVRLHCVYWDLSYSSNYLYSLSLQCPFIVCVWPLDLTQASCTKCPTFCTHSLYFLISL